MHPDLVPVDLCKAIGINWFRVESSSDGLLSRDEVYKARDHYGADNILWLIRRTQRFPLGDAILVAQAGIKAIEVFNESYIGGFNPGGKPITAAAYVSGFRTYRQSLLDTALYGPAGNVNWCNAVMALNPDIDVVTWHYINPSDIDQLRDIEQAYRRSILGSETGSIRAPLEAKASVKQSVSDLAAEYFVAMTRSMGDRPWAYYPGTDKDDPRSLFMWTGKEFVPTDTYRIIRDLLTPSA